jgi:hypothetical protein
MANKNVKFKNLRQGRIPACGRQAPPAEKFKITIQNFQI